VGVARILRCETFVPLSRTGATAEFGVALRSVAEVLGSVMARRRDASGATASGRREFEVPISAARTSWAHATMTHMDLGTWGTRILAVRSRQTFYTMFKRHGSRGSAPSGEVPNKPSRRAVLPERSLSVPSFSNGKIIYVAGVRVAIMGAFSSG
jgi:hypothetical protein